MDEMQNVSSRAPVWGASEPPPGIWTVTGGFKSCPRVGGIQYALVLCFSITVFQVVPPCGGHPLAFDGNGLINMFQVVPPCGGHPY